MMLFCVIDQPLHRFQQGIDCNFHSIEMGFDFRGECSVVLMDLSIFSCPFAQTGETESDHRIPIRNGVVKIFPDDLRTCSIPQQGIFVIFPIYVVIDFSVPLCQQRQEGAFSSVVRTESGEDVMRIDIDLQVSANIFKASCFYDRFRKIFLFQLLSKSKCIRRYFIAVDSGFRVKHRTAELVDEIFPILIKALV